MTMAWDGFDIPVTLCPGGSARTARALVTSPRPTSAWAGTGSQSIIEPTGGLSLGGLTRPAVTICAACAGGMSSSMEPSGCTPTVDGGNGAHGPAHNRPHGAHPIIFPSCRPACVGLDAHPARQASAFQATSVVCAEQHLCRVRTSPSGPNAGRSFWERARGAGCPIYTHGSRP